MLGFLFYIIDSLYFNYGVSYYVFGVLGIRKCREDVSLCSCVLITCVISSLFSLPLTRIRVILSLQSKLFMSCVLQKRKIKKDKLHILMNLQLQLSPVNFLCWLLMHMSIVFTLIVCLLFHVKSFVIVL